MHSGVGLSSQLVKVEAGRLLEPCNLSLVWTRKAWGTEEREGEGEMAQLIMYMVYKHKDLSSVSLQTLNKLVMAASVYNPHRGSGDRKIPVARWPASSARIEEFRFSISKRKAESN